MWMGLLPRKTDRAAGRRGVSASLLAGFLFPTFLLTPMAAHALDIEKLLSAVVKVTTEVPADARTARALGTQREGSGVVIDGDGLVLTIGYLILESMGATVTTMDGRTVQAHFVAYDHDTGFGLLRAMEPLKVAPIALGDSAKMVKKEPVLVSSFGGPENAMGAFVASRREFAGSWEYLLENAIYTQPPHPIFGGAALIDQKGRLVGIGSLILRNVTEGGNESAGNMFVPIDALKPILGELLAHGRAAASPPWLGLYAQEHQGKLFAVRVPTGGPAHKAGVRPGDVVLGVGDKPVTGLADFYRKVRAKGKAGVTVPLTVMRDGGPGNIKVKSMDRYDWLKLKMSY